MELVIRLLALSHSTDAELKSIPDVSDFLTEKLKYFAESDFNWNEEKELLAKTFRIINATLSDNGFKRFNDNGEYKGGFQLSIYEIIATGTYLYLQSGLDENNLPKLLRDVSQQLPSNEVFTRYSGSGSKANYRWPRFVPLARQFFLNENQD